MAAATPPPLAPAELAALLQEFADAPGNFLVRMGEPKALFAQLDALAGWAVGRTPPELSSQADALRDAAVLFVLRACFAANNTHYQVLGISPKALTPEGLRIQVIDQEGKPMFPSGSAQMFDKTKLLMQKVNEIIKPQPNELSIRGHTDSVPYGPDAAYTNWELSADRANSSRRVMLEHGMAAERFHDVVGKSDTEPLVPEDPKAAKNRRISIILLKEELTNPDYAKKVEEAAEGEISEEPTDSEESGEAEPQGNFPKVGTFRKTPGAVEFP